VDRRSDGGGRGRSGHPDRDLGRHRSAVAHAYHGVPHVFSVVLFPIAEVSNRQRKQMTTLGGNVSTFGVDGKFDDCQAMVKRAFADPDLAGLRMSSANSINVGRLLPQSVYYVYAYVRLADVRAMEPIVFSVPSGNFGDMMGGILAMKMGIPIRGWSSRPTPTTRSRGSSRRRGTRRSFPRGCASRTR